MPDPREKPTWNPYPPVSKMTPEMREVVAVNGRLSALEVARILGRKSGLRAMACALGVGQHLPALPPPELDGSLRNDARDVARHVRNLYGPPDSTNSGGTKLDRTA